MTKPATLGELGPLDHVERPLLPWRRVGLTECGLPSANHPVITRDEHAERVKKLGVQRASFLTCQTCTSAAGHGWPTWAENPVGLMSRETQVWRCWGGPRPAEALLDAELRAIAALVEAHRDEFDGYLSGLADVESLATRRIAKRRQATR